MVYHADYSRTGIDKLTVDNYQVWKQRVKLFLTREDLWDTVIQPPPLQPTDDWRKKNRVALATIGLHLSDRYLLEIDEIDTAHEAWKSITSAHEKNDIGSRLLLYRTLLTMRYTRHSDMGEHLSRMMGLAARLSAIGHTVKEELMCSALLGSLPPEYDALITTIEGRADEDITSKYVRDKIMTEYTRKLGSLQDTPAPSPTKALVSHKNPRTYGSPQNNINFYCNKVGHIRRDCRTLRQHQTHQDLGESSRDDPRRNYNQSNLTITEHTYDDHNQTPIKIPKDETEHISLITQLRALSNYSDENPSIPGKWIVDSGASCHMTYHQALLDNYKILVHPLTVTSAGGKIHKVMGTCSRTIMLKEDQGDLQPLQLSQVLYVPALTENLLSISKLADEGFVTSFHTGEVFITLKKNPILLAQRMQGLYVLDEGITTPPIQAHTCIHTWHSRLGHRHYEGINRLRKNLPDEEIPVSFCNSPDFCSTCQLSKMKNKPFYTNTRTTSIKPFTHLHSDVCGPISPLSLGGNQYILSIIDDFSNYATTFLMRHKSDTFDHIRRYIEQGENLHGHRPIALRTDGGGEYSSHEMEDYLTSKGIVHQTTFPYSPQENGKAEKFNNTLLDSIRALLKQGKLPKNLWGEISSTSTYLINLNLPKNQETTPFEIWHKRAPSYHHLRVVGSSCYFLNNNPNTSKLDDRAQKGTLVGYGPSSGMYRVWSPETQRIFLSRKSTFPPDQCPNTLLDGQIESVELTPPTEYTTNDTLGVLEPDHRQPNHEEVEAHIPRRSTRHNRGQPHEILTYETPGQSISDVQDWYIDHPTRPIN